MPRAKKRTESFSAIFVGGYNDGLRMFIPEWLPIVELPVPPDRQLSWGKIEHEQYVLTFICAGESSVAPFYRSKDMSESVAVDRLLRHYQPPKMVKVPDIVP